MNSLSVQLLCTHLTLTDLKKYFEVLATGSAANYGKNPKLQLIFCNKALKLLPFSPSVVYVAKLQDKGHKYQLHKLHIQNANIWQAHFS